MIITKGFLFRTYCNKEVNHHMTFGWYSKAGRKVRKLYCGKKGKVSDILDWEKLTYRTYRQLNRSMTCYVIGSVQFSSVQFSHSVVSNSLQPHGLQHARLPCPSPTPRIYSNSFPFSGWCHPTISFSVVPFSSHLQPFLASKSFPKSQFFTSGGPKYWSFSFSILPMHIHDWFPLGWLVGSPCCPRDSQESSPTPQFKSINASVLSFLYGPTLTSIHDYWKNHGFHWMDFCWPSNVSLF